MLPINKYQVITPDYINKLAETYASKRHQKYIQTRHQRDVLDIKWLRVREAYIDAYNQALADLKALQGE